DPSVHPSAKTGRSLPVSSQSLNQISIIKSMGPEPSPGTMTGINLDSYSKLFNVFRNTAATATGTVVFTGTAGTLIPLGTELIRADGTIYTTTTSGDVGDNISVVATSSGIDGNAPSGTQLLVSPVVAGVDNSLTIANAITGGTDVEDDAALRSRMYASAQTIPAGGSPADHVNWLEAVPGVVQAWCDPVPTTGNIVTCYVMFADDNGNNGLPTGTSGCASNETRLPAASGDLLTVANAVYDQKPVGELMWIAAPLPQPIDITISGMTGVTAAIQANIQKALTTYVRSIATPLGTTVYLASLESVIVNTASTTSFTLSSPASNVSVPLGSVPVIGTITYE
ncbi:baseplate J/gp47 family protein, partial [Gluconobacter albidus]|uniref:baseplate J/gp47 family protein n=4 Tax=Gluconobacter albidus TaxID=318683 RepID=UPI0024E0C475